MKKLFFLAILILTGCSQSLIITQGEHGYAGALSEEYDIYHLKEVRAENYSVLGFSLGNDRHRGKVVNFFGRSTVYGSNFLKNIISGLNIVCWSAIGAAILPSDALVIGAFGGGLFAGATNELIFHNSTQINAEMAATRKLIAENPNIDLFIYPKYNISSSYNIFSSKCELLLRSKGASLKSGVLKNFKSDVINIDGGFYDKPSPKTKIQHGQYLNKIIEANLLNEDICKCNAELKEKITVTENCQKLLQIYNINTPSGKKAFEHTVKINCQ